MFLAIERRKAGNWPKEKKVIFSSKTQYPTNKDTEYRIRYDDGSESNFSIPKHLEDTPVMRYQSGGVQSKDLTHARGELDNIKKTSSDKDASKGDYVND